MRINAIKNVNNTLNKSVSFKSGVQTNYGIQTPNPKDNMVEGGLLTGFVGTLIPLFTKTHQRAQSIEKGLNDANLDYTA